MRRIVALGDSTTAGTPGFLSPLESPPHGSGDETSQYAYWLMKLHPDWEVLNRGINGERTDQIRARFERDVTQAHPEVVVLLAGVNDVYQGYPLAHIQANLQAMYARAAELGIHVVACSVLPYDTARPEQNERLRQLNAWLAEQPGVTFCDTHRAVQAVTDEDHLRSSPEGLHPTPAGYHRMAVALKAPLARLLGQPVRHREPDPSLLELPARPPLSIAILGAGMAGLAAAEALVRAGHEVVIFEAQNRAGGRVRTLRECFAAGLHVEAGAKRFPDTHLLTMAYCRRLGMRLLDFATRDDGDILFFGGQRCRADGTLPARLGLPERERNLSLHQLRSRYLDPLLARFGDPHDPGWPATSLLALDDLSFADLLRQEGASPEAVRLLGADFNVGQGYEGASALWLLRSYALERHRSHVYKIQGGNDLLPHTLAEPLSSCIRYGTQVIALAQDEQRVQVTFRTPFQDHTESFDRVICTLPFSVLDEVEFQPALSAAKCRAIRELPYASMLKVFLQTRTRFWEKEGLSGFATVDLGMMEIWNGTRGETKDERGILLAYLGGTAARQLAHLDETARLQQIVERLCPIFPGLKEHYEGGMTWSWDAQPWAQGAGAWYAVGQIRSLYPHVATPEGRIHFAGEHTSKFPGWVQGALESGQRAALEVVQ